MTTVHNFKPQSNYLRSIIVVLMILGAITNSSAQTDVENINRGVVAVKKGANGIYVGWRNLNSDPENIAFDLFRVTDGSPVKLNDEPISGATNYLDESANLAATNQYYVVPIIDETTQEPSLTAETWSQNFLDVPLQRPSGGTSSDGVSYSYEPNDASVADLDGDGEYEIILKWMPTNSKDNSQGGFTGNTILDAYEFDGTQLWRIDFGINVRSGAHYAPFMVYDLDDDGIAEIVARTAPGTKDGMEQFLSHGPAANDNDNADYRNNWGYILTGPEYLTVFKGTDGSELQTINLEPNRGSVSDWGDDYGNRVDRFLGAVAYLDGEKPSVLWCRGIYTKVEIAAYDWDGQNLSQRWIFKSQEGYEDWSGMGSHNLSIGDVDLDGRDEIVYGHCAIDEYGKGLWSLKKDIGTSTGDAMHLADMVPERPGLERWACGEYSNSGSHLVDAATGEILWKTPAGDVGRATAGDLTPDFYGMEVWGGTDGLRSSTNEYAGNWPSSTNHVVWWDADLGRELLNDIHIDKYGAGNLLTATGCYSNNGSKANPCLQADIFGDWREEVIWRTADNRHLRIYTTTDVTEYRLKTLMHDRQYRLAIAWQNNSYNQPPHTSFYLGYDMDKSTGEIPPSSPKEFNVEAEEYRVNLSWRANIEGDIQGYYIYKSVDNGPFESLSDAPTNITSLSDSAISLYTVYKYYVVAVDNDGNESEPSAVKSAFPTLVEPYPPHNIIGRMGDKKNLVFWNAIQENIFSSEQEGLVLKHSYTFNDGDVKDAIGSADGTLFGGTISNGKYKATSNGDYFELPASAIAINTYSAITLEAVITANVDNTEPNMMAYFGGNVSGLGGNGYFLTPDRWEESRTAISCGNLTQPWTAEQGVTGDPVSVGKTHHIVSVLNDSTITLYIDGNLVGKADVSGNNSIANISNDKAWLCRGGYNNDPTWLGTIDEFNIYEGSMNAATVTKRAYNYERSKVAGYNVYYSINKSSLYWKLNKELITDTTFIHSDLENGTRYNYMVKSVTDDNNESYWPNPVSVIPGDSIVVQAEEGFYFNARVENTYKGYSGTGYIAFDPLGFANLDYVYSPDSGWYNVLIKHAQNNDSGMGEITVNDSTFTYVMATTSGWTNYVFDTLKVKLNAEFENTIRVEALNDDFGLLDEIVIGSKTSDTINTSINDILIQPSLTAYPNPFRNTVTIVVSLRGNVNPTIAIYNVLGMLVESAEITESDGRSFKYQWNAEHLNPGIYIASISLEGKPVNTIKLIRKN